MTGSRPRALLVGLDGVRHDCLLAAPTPVLDELAARGVAGSGWLYAPPVAQTSSGPGWTTLATGVWPDRHGVLTNELGSRRAGYPDLLSRIARQRRSLTTLVAASWPPLAAAQPGGPLFAAADQRLQASTGSAADRDRWVVDAAAAALAGGRVDVAFVHLDAVDAAGHDAGTGPRYTAAIAGADRHLGRLLAALAARPGYRQEDWLVVVATDHGHTDSGGHGGGSWPERRCWAVAAGGTLPAGQPAGDIRPVDVVPTVLRHLGLPLPAPAGADDLDGRPLQRGPDAGQFGLSLPAGWRRAGGPGRLGWRSVAAERWCGPGAAGGRESFARGRGLLAVVDPAAPAARSGDRSAGPPPVPVEAVLLSPPVPVIGGAVLVSFGCHYRHAPGQDASVTVLAGGERRLVWRAAAGADPAGGAGDLLNRRVRLDVPLPGAVRSVRIRWRLRSPDPARVGFWAVAEPRADPA